MATLTTRWRACSESRRKDSAPSTSSSDGTQDLWDVRELLRGADARALTEAVEAELRALPAAMQAAWNIARS